VTSSTPKAPKPSLTTPRSYLCPNCVNLGEWDDPQGSTALGASILVWCPDHPVEYKFNAFLGTSSAHRAEILAECRYGSVVMYTSTAPEGRLSTSVDFVLATDVKRINEHAPTAKRSSGVFEAAQRAIALGMMEHNQ